jgi:hypothetical protein
MDHRRRRGHPPGKKTKTAHQKTSILGSDPPALSEDLQETDSEEDYGEEEWDPHAGTKPSPIDGEALDEYWDPEEDDPEEVKSKAFNALMVEMLSDLEDNDLRDHEWKPKHKRRKASAKTPKSGQFTTIH